MQSPSWSKSRARAFAAAFIVFCSGVQAQTSLLDEVHTVAGSDSAVPEEHDFDISVAGSYQLTLTDLGAALTPSAPVASIKLAVTSGNAVVGTPLTAAGNMQFTAVAGHYVIHVVGRPGSTPGSGPIGIQVSSVPDATMLVSFSDTLALPGSGIASNNAVIDDSFTVPNSGNFQVTLSDLQLPQALTTVTLIIVQEGGSLITVPPLATAGSTTVALQSGVTYRILAVGSADPAVNAGLYSAVVSPTGGGAPVFSRIVPVGTVVQAGSASVVAGSYTLSFTDLAFPNSSDLATPNLLASMAAVGTVNGAPVAQFTAAGSQAFTAVAGSFQLFATATPGGSGSGSYAVLLTPQGGGAVLSTAKAVTAAGGTTTGYSFDTTLAMGGTFAFDLADFSFPTAFQTVTAAAVQAGATVGAPLSAAGISNVTLAAGPVSLLVFAQPAATGGLFGIDLGVAGSDPVFSVTQGVGQLFDARQITVTSAGSYTVAVSDVGFPSAFANLAAVVTQGSNRIGYIFTGGTFKFPASPGKYFVNFIAQPGGSDNAGTYAISVAPSPPTPVVVLSADKTSVASGGTANLTWSAQNATSCTATGGWTGAREVSGTEKSAALTTSTTFTLSCSGSGGSSSQAVTVNIDPARSGGGGALDSFLLALAGVLAVLRLPAASRWRLRN